MDVLQYSGKPFSSPRGCLKLYLLKALLAQAHHLDAEAKFPTEELSVENSEESSVVELESSHLHLLPVSSCMRTYTQTDRQTQTQTRTQTQTQTRTRTQTQTQTDRHRHRQTDRHTQTHRHTHRHTHMYTPTCTHAHAHTNTNTNTPIGNRTSVELEGTQQLQLPANRA